jgi:hypothetical protein
MTRAIGCVLVIAGVLLFRAPASTAGAAQSDLDGFMQQVLARRDDNWKKLQQYILDEREQIELRGPARFRLWGQQRDYTWYLRDGFFVRSPLKFNGVTISETDRRKYESDYLKHVQEQERRADDRQKCAPSGSGADPSSADSPPTDVTGLIRQSQQPQFISSAYFMRFRFDAGTYALVGREQVDGQDVLRIEYYPTNLFREERRCGRDGQEWEAKKDDALILRLLNKVALVTLWIEPVSHQIVKSTFDNVSFDFLPGQWLVHVEDVKASITMSRPFPDVWLPQSVKMNVAMQLAIGQVDFSYALDYHDYRLADATVKIR